MSLEPAIPEAVLAAIRAPFLAQDAAPIDAPVLQPLGLLLDLAGEAMRARLFVVQGDNGEEACLRPDFTIAIAREHVACGAAAGRYRYEGRAFRVAPRDAVGHPEESLQIGLEAFGGADVAQADAAVAALAWRASVAGGRDDLSMVMGDVGLFAAFIEALGLADPLTARLRRAFVRPRALAAELARAQEAEGEGRQGDRLAALLAGLPEAEAADVLRDIWALAGIQPVGGRSARAIAHRLVERAEAAKAPRLTAAEAGLIGRFLAISDAPRAALDAAAAIAKEGRVEIDAVLAVWNDRLDRLAAEGGPTDRMTLSTAFGRAFGYYDGFLFEVRSPAFGADMPVAGGGRYDALLARLGASGAASAVGCMVRPARAWAGGAA